MRASELSVAIAAEPCLSNGIFAPNYYWDSEVQATEIPFNLDSMRVVRDQTGSGTSHLSTCPLMRAPPTACDTTPHEGKLSVAACHRGKTLQRNVLLGGD